MHSCHSFMSFIRSFISFHSFMSCIPSFLHSFIHSSIHYMFLSFMSCIHSLISLIPSFLPSFHSIISFHSFISLRFIHFISCIPSFLHAFHSFLHSFMSFIHSFHSCISCTHSFHAFIHSFLPSSIQSFIWKLNWERQIAQSLRASIYLEALRGTPDRSEPSGQHLFGSLVGNARSLIQQLARDIVFLHLQDFVDPLHALGSFLGEGDNTGWQLVETSTAAQVANLSATIHSG